MPASRPRRVARGDVDGNPCDQPKKDIDQLADLAKALETTADEIIAGDDEDDVVIRPPAQTPNSITGYGGPVDILTIFDHHGEEAHLRPIPS